MEAASVVIAYLQTIRAISSRLREREKKSRSNAKLYEDVEVIAKDIQTHIAAEGKVIDPAREDQFREAASTLPRIRELLSTARSRKDINTAVKSLREARAELLPPPAVIGNPSIHISGEENPDTETAAVAKDGVARPELSEQEFATKVKETSLFPVKGAPEAAELDVIFVHGLNGDPYTTWRGQTPTFWPKDLLGHDLEKCRVWTYSSKTIIDMTLQDQPPLQQVLEQMADDLLESIKLPTQKPIIWVAHSLGGLLVKIALLKAWVKKSPIVDLTRGVLFLGTPHSGSSLVSRSTLFTNIIATMSDPKRPSQAVVYPREKSLESTLTLWTSQFAVLMDERRLQIVSFYEKQPMLTERGPFILVESVTNLNHPGESLEFLEGNHLTMCKFETAQEKGYQTILGCIRDLQGGTFIPKRTDFFAERMSNKKPSKQSSASDAVNTDIGAIYSRLRGKLDRPLCRWKSFKSNDHRDGLWIRESTSYTEWMSDTSSKVLLVHGPVGCGKTVISESILEDLRDSFINEVSTLESPTENFTTDGHVTLKCHLHLFFRSDQSAQQDPITILESLIAQVLDQNKVLVRHINPKSLSGTSLTRVEAQAALEGSLRIMLEDSCWSTIYLVVDALDECRPSLAWSTRNIFASLLGLKNLRAIFTTSTEAVTPNEQSQPDLHETKLNLTSALKLHLETQKIKFTPLELRQDTQWTATIDNYINEQLESHTLTGKGELHPALRPQDLKTYKQALLGLPQISFSVVDLSIQRIDQFLHPSDGLDPPQDWFKKEIENLGESVSIYDRLLSLAQMQPKTGVLILSVLACAYEPLRAEQLAMIIQYDRHPSPVLPENKTWIASLKLETSLMKTMQGLVKVDGDGLHLSSDTLRRVVHDQMNQKLWGDSPFEGDEAQGMHFDKYEGMQGRMAQACLRILLHEGTVNVHKDTHKHRYFPSKAYAERNWRRHLRDAGPKAEGLNELVYKVVEMQQVRSAMTKNTYRNTGSRLLDYLITDNLAVSLGSIFTSNVGVSEYPDSSEFNSVLDTAVATSTPETLKTLQKVHSNIFPEEESVVEQRIAMSLNIIQGNKGELTQRLQHTGDMVKEACLNFALELQKLDFVDIILKSFEQSLSPLHTLTKALITAIKFQNRPLVRQLLSRNLKRLLKPSLNSGLIEAITPPNIGICEDLLQYGADVNFKTDTSKSTPLHLAAKRGHTNLVDLMLSWNASTNLKDSKRRTPLHQAAEFGHTDVVERLLACSTSVDVLDSQHRTPFFIACARGWKLTAKILWDAGSNMMHVDVQGQTALHAAAKTGHQSVVQMLLSAGIEVDHQDNQGITPLHEAAKAGWSSIVEALLDAGADINKPDKDGLTSLHHACRSQNAPEVTVKLLLDRHADPTARSCEREKDRSRTPLLLAAESSTVRVLKVFQNHNKDLFCDTDNERNGVYRYVTAKELEKSRSEIIREEKRLFLDKNFRSLFISNHVRARSTEARFAKRDSVVLPGFYVVD